MMMMTVGDRVDPVVADIGVIDVDVRVVGGSMTTTTVACCCRCCPREMI